MIGLDYLDPKLDPHQRFQEFKTHPYIKAILEGGSLYSYGAKSIPEGGYWALPQYYFNGGFIVYLNKDVQWDIRAGVGLNDAADDFFAGCGLVLRYY